MASQEIEDEARELIAKIKSADPATVVEAITSTMRMHYVKGGIDAVEAVLSSIPPKMLELPPEQLKLLAAMMTMLEGFKETLIGKLHRTKP